MRRALSAFAETAAAFAAVALYLELSNPDSRTRELLAAARARAAAALERFEEWSIHRRVEELLRTTTTTTEGEASS